MPAQPRYILTYLYVLCLVYNNAVVRLPEEVHRGCSISYILLMVEFDPVLVSALLLIAGSIMDPAEQAAQLNIRSWHEPLHDA